ncbi:MAG: hypothetical protein AAFP19_01580 [Bacteroidota bacterium]
MGYPSVLILGCGRSGTSIFGELFDHLADYSYYSEPSFAQLPQLVAPRGMAIKVPKESPNYPPDPGLSFPMAQLQKWLPKPIVYYWQIRHPLDTICSLKVGIARNWGHHPRPPDWREWSSEPLICRCAHHWNYLNSVAYEQVAELVKICRFEEMLSDPLSFAMGVLEDIGLDLTENELFIQSWANRVQNTNNAQFLEAATSRAYSTNDHRVRIGRWRENMTAEELALVLPIIARTAEERGYINLLE